MNQQHPFVNEHGDFFEDIESLDDNTRLDCLPWVNETTMRKIVILHVNSSGYLNSSIISILKSQKLFTFLKDAVSFDDIIIFSSRLSKKLSTKLTPTDNNADHFWSLDDGSMIDVIVPLLQAPRSHFNMKHYFFNWDKYLDFFNAMVKRYPETYDLITDYLSQIIIHQLLVNNKALIGYNAIFLEKVWHVPVMKKIVDHFKHCTGQFPVNAIALKALNFWNYYENNDYEEPKDIFDAMMIHRFHDDKIQPSKINGRDFIKQFSNIEKWKIYVYIKNSTDLFRVHDVRDSTMINHQLLYLLHENMTFYDACVFFRFFNFFLYDFLKNASKLEYLNKFGINIQDDIVYPFFKVIKEVSITERKEFNLEKKVAVIWSTCFKKIIQNNIELNFYGEDPLKHPLNFGFSPSLLYFLENDCACVESHRCSKVFNLQTYDFILTYASQEPNDNDELYIDEVDTFWHSEDRYHTEEMLLL